MNTSLQTIRIRPEWRTPLARLDVYLRRLQIEDPFFRGEIPLQAVALAAREEEHGRCVCGVFEHALRLIDDWFVCPRSGSPYEATSRRLRLVLDRGSNPRAAEILREKAHGSGEAPRLCPAPAIRLSKMRPCRPVPRTIRQGEWRPLYWFRRAATVPNLLAMSVAILTALMLTIHR